MQPLSGSSFRMSSGPTRKGGPFLLNLPGSGGKRCAKRASACGPEKTHFGKLESTSRVLSGTVPPETRVAIASGSPMRPAPIPVVARRSRHCCLTFCPHLNAYPVGRLFFVPICRACGVSLRRQNYARRTMPAEPGDGASPVSTCDTLIRSPRFPQPARVLAEAGPKHFRLDADVLR